MSTKPIKLRIPRQLYFLLKEFAKLRGIPISRYTEYLSKKYFIMPVPGYTTLTLDRRLYEKLQRIRKRYGVTWQQLFMAYMLRELIDLMNIEIEVKDR